MTVEWSTYAAIAVPIFTLFAGVFLNRVTERRPRVVTYLGHISAHRVPQKDGTFVDVFTHSVVLKNSGRLPARNVRISHANLPNFNVFPQVNLTTENLPDGGSDIVIPTLVPGQQITISYLYFPPTTWQDINVSVRSDEGFAKVLNVLPMVQYPKWFNAIAAGFMLIGLSTLLYLIVISVTNSW